MRKIAVFSLLSINNHGEQFIADCIKFLAQQADNTEITINHHPVLHTWLIRVFMRLGESLSLGYEFGIGVFSGVQMIALSYALTRLIFLMKKSRRHWTIMAIHPVTFMEVRESPHTIALK